MSCPLCNPQPKRCCSCAMLLHGVDGNRYTPGDDVDGDGICAWCRAAGVIPAVDRRLALVTPARGQLQ